MNPESRRDFLIQAGAVAASAVLPAIPVVVDRFFAWIESAAEVRDGNPLIYQELRAYQDKQLPPVLVEKLARDLSGLTAFPSIVQSGKMLLDNQKDPDLSRYDPILVSPEGPFEVAFMNLGTTVAMYYDSGYGRTTDNLITIARKDSPGSVTFLGINNETTDVTLQLHSGLIFQNASPAVYQLMLAKEASHVFYFAPARVALFDELERTYQFDKTPELEETLFASALSADDPRLKMPRVSRMFNGLRQFIDFAGYGHITPDLARMEAEGRLSEKDKQIMSVSIQAMHLARERKLIVQDPRRANVFHWAKGIGPFSMSWFDIMNETYRQFNMKTVSSGRRILGLDFTLLA